MSVQAQTALLAWLTRPAGEADADPRGVDPPPPEAPSDHDALHGRVRRRRAPHRGAGAHGRRHRRLRVGRAARCSSGRPATRAARTACRTSTSRPSPRTRTTRRAARCAASARTRRTSRWKAASTCSPRRSASTAGRCAGATRSRSATPSRPARCSRSRSASRRRCSRSKTHYDAARAAGRAVGIACGLKNSGIGNGVQRVGQGPARRRARRHRLALQRLHRDGPGLLTVLDAVRRRGHRPAGRGLPAEGRHDLRARLRPDHRLARDAVRRPRGGERGAEAAGRSRCAGARSPTSPARSSPPTSGRRHDRARRGRVQGEDAHVVRLRDAGRASSTTSGRVARVVAAHDVGRAVNPALCEGQIEGAIHMGLGYALTEELPCDDGMPVTFKLRELGVLRARDMPEVEVILVEDPEPEGPVRRQGRRRDRSGADGRRRRRRARGLRRRPALRLPDEGLAGGPRDERRHGSAARR